MVSFRLGLSTTSIPGPIGCARRLERGNTYFMLAPPLVRWPVRVLAQRTLVLVHPSLKAVSCAKSSPHPIIIPLMKGSNRLIAAPRRRDQIVGGW